MHTSVTYFMKFFTAQILQTVFPQPVRGSRWISARYMEVEKQILRSHNEWVTGGIGYASEQRAPCSGRTSCCCMQIALGHGSRLGVVRLHGFGPASGIGSATHGGFRGFMRGNPGRGIL